MKTKGKLSLLVLLTLFMTLKPDPSSIALDLSHKIPNSRQVDEQFTSIPQNEFNDIKRAMNLTKYDRNRAMDGLTLICLWKANMSTGEHRWVGDYQIVMDMEGNIKASQKNAIVYSSSPEFLNSTTVFFIDSYNAEDGSLVFWNIETGATEVLPIPAGHIDVEYNPFTDTFLTLQEAIYGEYNELPILYDDIYEFDRNGNVVWHWNCSEHIPFNETLYDNTISQGRADWTTANALFWDIEEDVIYLNSHRLHTFFKINKKTGDILWAIGKLGIFKMVDQNGQEKERLIYDVSALEKIGENRFIVFDNNFFDVNHQTLTSRYLEFVVDEETMTMNETWSWIAPPEYHNPPWGDADRLPNGNTIGVFGYLNHPVYLTEVAQNGDIVWEMKFEFLEQEQIHWGVYRIERFLEEPLIKINPDIKTNQDETITIELSTWNTFRTRYHSSASVKVMEGETIIAEEDFQFLPYWQETTISMSIMDLAPGYHDLRIIVENSDGKAAEIHTNWILVLVTPGDIYTELVITGALVDAYADSVITGISKWYLEGENTLGPPDGQFARLYADYGNGHVTLDMGEDEEILNGKDEDFTVYTRGGEYAVFVGNNLSASMLVGNQTLAPLILLGLGRGNTSFDLASAGLNQARYVQIVYFAGEDVELDAVVAVHFKRPPNPNPISKYWKIILAGGILTLLAIVVFWSRRRKR